jgi:hypothetical protein
MFEIIKILVKVIFLIFWIPISLLMLPLILIIALPLSADFEDYKDSIIYLYKCIWLMEEL